MKSETIPDKFDFSAMGGKSVRFWFSDLDLRGLFLNILTWRSEAVQFPVTDLDISLVAVMRSQMFCPPGSQASLTLPPSPELSLPDRVWRGYLWRH